ncbi:Bardet-Biedl syndrome 12 protein [Astyanax mexicanus]|uniref:Bardet-Biedl syndrome 12 protein n=1 Tax=Astyanax mexicanus TaxID=7994 RepID=UPI0020CADA1D|nr:Bardet-Biedl syndrome 12 protein [Astyanax mexicanus]
MSALGSGAVNQGRHIGLQQLEAVAASTHSFLGPNKRYKFIQDEATGESALVCSCYRLLEQLELSSSVGQLLHETVRAHQGTLHSGTGTVVFLAGVWSRVALECLHKGISIPHIIAGMSKGLDLCVEVCKRNAVTVEEGICKSAVQKQTNGLFTGLFIDTGVKKSTQDGGVKSINGVLNQEKRPLKHRIKLKHSRHFNSSSAGAEETHSVDFTSPNLHQKCSKTLDLTPLAEAVSHGCEASMRLVMEASRIQSTYVPQGHSSHNFLDVDRLVTCPLPGLSEEHSCVLHGYVVKSCSVEQVSLVKHFEERALKIGLINGDLTESYRHVGFNRPKNVTYIHDSCISTGVSVEQEWMDRALRILLNLSIDILLVNGMVTSQLKSHCLSHNILVIEHVKVTILNNFATTTGAVSVSYVTQLSERCVGSGVQVSVLRDYQNTLKTESSTLLNIVASATTLVTVIITSSVHAKLQSLEDQFWSCTYRLHHALNDGKLLPGAGMTELLCIRQLYRHKDVSQNSKDRQKDVAPYEPVILQLMAEGWMDYISTLMFNAGQVTAKAHAWTHIAQHLKEFESKSLPGWLKSPLKTYSNSTNAIQGKGDQDRGEGTVERDEVYDNMTVKFEAWRGALDLVFLILQTDTEIITGINESDSQFRDVMFL